VGKGNTITDQALDAMLDELAAIEHERWAHWQRYVHEQGVLERDGSLTIPAELVARWERQITTHYEDLSEAEKNSDKDQVARYLDLIKERLATASQ
jgi:hypothetical protein